MSPDITHVTIQERSDKEWLIYFNYADGSNGPITCGVHTFRQTERTFATVETAVKFIKANIPGFYEIKLLLKQEA